MALARRLKNSKAFRAAASGYPSSQFRANPNPTYRNAANRFGLALAASRLRRLDVSAHPIFQP